MKNIMMISAICAFVSCATRAPSTNELDKKAGLSPALDADAAKKDVKELRKSEEKKKEKDVDPDKPRRSFPRIERIWVYGQELAPTVYMQGTSLFLEVTPGAWISGEGGAQ